MTERIVLWIIIGAVLLLLKTGDQNHSFPPPFQQVPMDAQWMLNGCSMDASPNQSTLTKLYNPENEQVLRLV